MSSASRLLTSALGSLGLALACSHTGPLPESMVRGRSNGEARLELDEFETLAPWQVRASDGVSGRTRAVLGFTGKALQLEFDFRGRGGYVSARRSLSFDLPANYELSFEVRGTALPNDFQVKLLDASGENVWWVRRADFEFPSRFQRFTIKKRQLEFAWGPSTDRELRHVAALEFVVAAGKGGGQGFVAVDDLQLRALPVPPAHPPAPRAWASSGAGSPALAIDGKLDTAWRSAAGAAEQYLALDFGYPREFGGVVLRWKPGARASRYDIELSDDARHWRLVRQVTDADGERDAVRLPEAAARFLRLNLHAGPSTGYELRELEVKELSFGATPNAFVSALAQESPRGVYPRGFRGEQSYWTLLAVEGASDSALISEDGALEVGKGGFSIEPFVVAHGKRLGWADVEIEQTLREGYLPLPSVIWHHPEWQLRVSAFAMGEASASELAVRYELENRTERPLELTLVLAVRPFQVNPPTQTLNLIGGVSPIRTLHWDGAVLAVNGRSALLPSKPPDRVGLSTFDSGGFPSGPLPASGRPSAILDDATGLASAALVYELRIPKRQSVALGLTAPLGGAAFPRERSLAELEREEERVASGWRDKLNRVGVTVPVEAQSWVDTLRSSLAQILMSREGPMLKPGTRSYARSWIRDGAMMSESLLRLGHAKVAAEYLAWYTPHQFPNGKVPCCVDARGADPVPEHDSAGELIFLAAETYRYTRDRALLERFWPAVERAAEYLEGLRQSERSERNTSPERRIFYGLMPPSISHEGYSDRPAYSYWDDFWALIGFQDATELAEALGHTAVRKQLAERRDSFRADLSASIRASSERYGISFIPGAADRGDFDATSTTIALAPGREASHDEGREAVLPKELLLSTFERYYREFEARRTGARSWDVYTPYELRTIGSLVRLGFRERAGELLRFFLQGRRPAAWNQWAEVVGRDLRQPRFIGDMPHAWVASDYIRSLLDLFVYPRADEQCLVVAAGLPASFWEQGGVQLRDLRTAYGTLGYSIAVEGKRVVVHVRGTPAPGGFALPWPWQGAKTPAVINGKPAAWQNGELRFRELPVRISFDRPSAPFRAEVRRGAQ